MNSKIMSSLFFFFFVDQVELMAKIIKSFQTKAAYAFTRTEKSMGFLEVEIHKHLVKLKIQILIIFFYIP